VKKSEIEALLDRVNFEDYYQSKVTIKSRTGDELHALCPFHDDKEASFSVNKTSGLWKCFTCGIDGNIFQFVQKLENVNFEEAVRIVADFSKFLLKSNDYEKRPLIDPKLPKKYLENLLKAKKVLDWIQEKKGLTLDTIGKYEIGWDGRRNTIPIYDEKRILKNIRLYNQKKKPKFSSFKTKNHTYGEGRICGVDEILSRPDETIALVAGEWDKLLASQHGFLAVTGTVGEATFKAEWKQFFSGRDVIVIYDMDAEGKRGADNAAKALLGIAASIKIVRLPVKGTKDEKDLSDYFLKVGATTEDLTKLIEATPLFSMEPEILREEPVKPLESFIEIDLKENIDRRVTVPLAVSGETSEAFHGVSKFRVQYCESLEHGDCNRCPPEKIFVIPPGDKEFIESCMSTEAQVIGFLRFRICSFGKKKPRIKILEKSTVREFFATQRTKRFFSRIGTIGVDERGGELVERRVYFVSDRLVKPQSYLATGYIRTHPKTQQVCLLATNLEPIEEEYESFILDDEVKKNLKKIREFTPEGLVEILSKEILFLKHREELILAILLTYCCPLRIRFNQLDIRGWLNTVVLGDSGTGKTAAVSRLADYISIGDMVSGLSSSRTGITYGLKEHKQKGWMIKIGRYPANSRKFVCIDEIQYIKDHDIRTLGKAMDEGFLTIDRIAEKTLESMTRLVALANPREDKVMDDLMFGCEGFRDLFDKAIIRRFDLAVCLSHSDIKSKELNLPNVEIAASTLPKRMLRDLIFWIWTRSIGSIWISKTATDSILEKSTILSEKFGHASDVPLVAPGDFSNKLARVSTAYAALCVSSDDEFKNIKVESEHVDFATSLFDIIYSGEAFGLKEYSEIYQKQTQLWDYDEIKKVLEEAKQREKHGDLLEGKSRIEQLLYAFKMHPEMRRRELADEIDAEEKTVGRKLQLLSRFNLIDSGPRGYFKKPKFIKFLRRLARDPETSLVVDEGKLKKKEANDEN